MADFFQSQTSGLLILCIVVVRLMQTMPLITSTMFHVVCAQKCTVSIDLSAN